MKGEREGREKCQELLCMVCVRARLEEESRILSHRIADTQLHMGLCGVPSEKAPDTHLSDNPQL